MRSRTQLAALLAVLLVSSPSTFAQEDDTGEDSSSTTSLPSVQPSSTLAPDGSSTAASPGTGTTETAGTTDTPGSTTSGAPTTTEPIAFDTFSMKNDFTPQDAKLILQQAVQLKNQISDLNKALQQAQLDTDPSNSPLFNQLAQVNQTLSAKSATLQVYINQLNGLNATQVNIDSRINYATDKFLCFANSGCVTPTPTTPEPTTPGPTPSETPCTPQSLNANDGSPFKITDETHVNCSATITPKVAANIVSLTVTLTLDGSKNGYVNVIESRTGRTISFNSTTTKDQQVNVTGPALIQYYADSKSNITFNIAYSEVSSCSLNCINGGKCVVSPSGVSYCQCETCKWTGDFCENPVTPCQTKQKRNCGENTGIGQCVPSTCFDQCYVCRCVEGAESDDNKQMCKKPATFKNGTIPTTDPPCPSTSTLYQSTTTPFVSTSIATVPVSTATSEATSGTGTVSSTVAGPGTSTLAPTSTAASGGDSTSTVVTTTEESTKTTL